MDRNYALSGRDRLIQDIHPVQEDIAAESRRKPVFDRDFSLSDFIASRSVSRPSGQAMDIVRPATTRKAAQTVNKPQDVEVYRPYKEPHTYPLASGFWNRFKVAPVYYSLSEGVERIGLNREALKAAGVGFVLLVAVLFTFTHHSAAPGMSSPDTADTPAVSAGTNAEDTAAAAVANPNGNSSYTGTPVPSRQTSGTHIQLAGSAADASYTPAISPASPATSGTGGMGGGSDPGLQPSTPAVSPTPSPGPSTDIPGVTSPYPVALPGTSVQDPAGKQLIGTSPSQITLN